MNRRATDWQVCPTRVVLVITAVISWVWMAVIVAEGIQ